MGSPSEFLGGVRLGRARVRIPQASAPGSPASAPVRSADPMTRAGGQLAISFLGGLGEIGMNCMSFTYRGSTLAVDCGSMFGGVDEVGVSRYLPDLDLLAVSGAAPDGLVLTHGHEDHIGAVPAALERWPDLEVYGTRFTLAILDAKLEEYNISAKLREIHDWEQFTIGEFSITPVPVAHNIPDGLALCIDLPTARIFHSGDLKVDRTSVDGRDLIGPRLDELLAERAVDLLLLDSTNATVPGRTQGERSLHGSIEHAMNLSPDGRVVCSTFASNVHRHEAFINAADDAKRTVYVVGRSIERTTTIASDLGILSTDAKLHFPFGKGEIDTPPGSTFVLTTGSQAEPRSGLALMARGQHRFVSITHDDVVVLSSSRVPGNERAIAELVSALMRRGAQVVDISNCDIHASGHAASDDLREIISTLNPRNVVPIHGEYRHLHAQRDIAIAAGVDEQSVHLCVDGTTLTVSADGRVRFDRASARRVATDDFLQEIGHDALKERNYLGSHGALVAVVTFGPRPIAILRQSGWLSDEEFEQIAPSLELELSRKLSGQLADDATDVPADKLERLIRRSLGPLVADVARGRKPRLVPIAVGG